MVFTGHDKRKEDRKTKVILLTILCLIFEMITLAPRAILKSDASLAARPIIVESLPAFACVVFLLMTGASAALGGSASATIQKGKITDPSVAAQRLYNAWKKKSKKAALKVASPAAVNKLFGAKWRLMKFKGCRNTGGSFECTYRDTKLGLDLAMEVEGGASAGYHVESRSLSLQRPLPCLLSASIV